MVHAYGFHWLPFFDFRGFNSTISAVEKAGAWEYALHFFDEMFAAELQQDVSLFIFCVVFKSVLLENMLFSFFSCDISSIPSFVLSKKLSRDLAMLL